MHPADEYVRLKDQIRALEARAHALRYKFISGQAPLASNAVEISVQRQKRRVFIRDSLPDYILKEPSLWEEDVSDVVTYQAASAEKRGGAASEDANMVIDDW
ncbi:MAG: hypothetical protein MK180_16140 [Rhodobacteraceae bacterium]|nr:hypothetical protein [Paracoccaceae bacterium]